MGPDMQATMTRAATDGFSPDIALGLYPPSSTVARLGELNRRLGTQIVISGYTHAPIRDLVEAHGRGAFPVRGRTHRVDGFELLGVQMNTP